MGPFNSSVDHSWDSCKSEEFIYSVLRGGVDEKISKSSIWYPASIRLLIRVSVSKVDSGVASLPNWLLDWLIVGNVNRIAKLVLGWTGTGDLPILNPTR